MAPTTASQSTKQWRVRHPPPNVAVPPRALALLGADTLDLQSQRDKHIRLIAEKDRIGGATGYGRRSLVEPSIGRYKHFIGSRLRARGLVAQHEQSRVGVAWQNPCYAGWVSCDLEA
jgi:hypothetical protein